VCNKCNISLLLYLFFFFQAEDGIRDFHVTGVQTCALPIYGSVASRAGSGCIIGLAPHPADRTMVGLQNSRSLRVMENPSQENGRSEERRVGKECRSRWSPEQEKNK